MPPLGPLLPQDCGFHGTDNPTLPTFCWGPSLADTGCMACGRVNPASTWARYPAWTHEVGSQSVESDPDEDGRGRTKSASGARRRWAGMRAGHFAVYPIRLSPCTRTRYGHHRSSVATDAVPARHADYATIAKYYAHLTPEGDDGAVAKPTY